MKYPKKELLYYWNLTKAIGAKRIKYDAFGIVRRVGNDVFGAKKVGNKLLIVIAGSNDFRDWLSNLRVMKLPKKRDVHKGFYLAAKAMREDIEYVIGLFDGIDQIIFAGHSRGGALSEELSRYVVKYLKLKSSVITFGSPKLGGAKYIQESCELNLEVDRFEYQQDVVTKLPPSIGGFKKHGIIHKLKYPWWFKLPIKVFVHTHYGIGIKKIKG